MWEEEQVAEKLKLHNEKIQLMRHQPVPDSPKITKNREQWYVSIYTGFSTGIEKMGWGGSLKFDGRKYMGESVLGFKQCS